MGRSVQDGVCEILSAVVLLFAVWEVGCETASDRIERLGGISVKQSMGRPLTDADRDLLQLELGTTEASDWAVVRQMEALREGHQKSEALMAARAATYKTSSGSSSDFSSWSHSSQNNAARSHECTSHASHQGGGSHHGGHSHKCK
jgi:hypothetical protein